MSDIPHLDGCRFRIDRGDCVKSMRAYPDGCFDSIVTDPPYGLAFMGAEWDTFGRGKPFGNDSMDVRREKALDYAKAHKGAPRYGNGHGPGRMSADEALAFQEAMVPIFTEALRVAKSGAYLLCFGGTRTFHRMACAIEDAGWNIRDCIMWVYGCLDEETEILVDGEFVPYNKAKTGSLALGYDIERGTFSWQRIEDTYLYDYDDTAYAIQSDSTDQLVSRNHRCIVERGGVEQFALAELVALEREARVPILESLHGLLDCLPLPDERTGDEEQDLLEGVRGEGGEPSAKEAQGARAEHHVPSVRERVLHTDGVEAQGEDELLLKELQGQGGERPEATGIQQGASHADVGGAEGAAQEGNGGRGKPVLEGRRVKGERECAETAGRSGEMPEGIPSDGTEERLDSGAPTRGGAVDWKASGQGGGRASHRPRPIEQRPVEPDAVQLQRGPQEVRNDGFSRTALARVTPVHYKGKMWCVKVATGAFVARRHGKIFITGNSGFPHGMNVGRALPEWEGWNTQLKPAWEPIIVAQKPLDGTVAHNIMAHGVGAINIDGCRVPTEEFIMTNGVSKEVQDRQGIYGSYGEKKTGQTAGQKLGRFPANLVHDGSDEVLALFPESKSSSKTVPRKRTPQTTCYGTYDDDGDYYVIGRGDSGSAARFFNAFREGEESAGRTYADRFFYCAKASKKDRGEGNNHPTVKPTALMQWLVRLVTPKGGVVLDPFAGSGSTGVAAMREGMDFVGMEMDEGYADIMERRIGDELS